MMKIRQILPILLLTTVSALQAQEDEWEKWGPTDKQSKVGVLLRAGYTIGGTTPLPLPEEIRSIKEFSPKGGATVGVDAYKMFSRRWGASIGWHFFYEGFHTVAEVKNYKMSLTMEGNTMSGYFTGTDVTNNSMWGMTIPLLATFRMSPRWNVSMGPYASVFITRKFDGRVYDNSKGVGYLRVDDPTGEKVNIDRENPATYDFDENMRTWNYGIELAFDWKALRHMNVFGKIDWGLRNVWPENFDAVDFRMYPIYATVGLAYRY